MFLRVFAVAAALTCAGCASEGPTLPYGDHGRMNLIGSAQAADAIDEMPAIPRKTLASKVLSAIALERVTGLKADPGRLAEID